MKKIVYVVSSIGIQVFLWWLSVFFLTEKVQNYIADYLGEIFWRSNGAAARPYLALYYFISFIIIFVITIFHYKLMKIKQSNYLLTLLISVVLFFYILINFALRFSFLWD